jgi:hypothetical protein
VSLADMVEQMEPRVQAHKVCTFTKIRSSLDPDDRATVDELMASEMSGSRIAEILTTYSGTRILGVSLQRHRRGDCTCEPV